MAVVARWSHKQRGSTHCRSDLAAPQVVKDITEFVSPVGQTGDSPGELISSRSHLREHERKHGVRQCGELKTAEEFDCKEQVPDSTDGVRVDVTWTDYEEKIT